MKKFATLLSISLFAMTVAPAMAKPDEPKVKLKLKLFLEGALKVYTGSYTSLGNLSKMRIASPGDMSYYDPYGTGAYEPNGEPNVLQLTDWIKIEIRDAVDPTIILETQSVLAVADGQVTRPIIDREKLNYWQDPSCPYKNVPNMYLEYPEFNPQPSPVRIVIKHYNHLAILSNVIENFTEGIIDYDFSSALTQAFNDGSAPDQMTSINNQWCMRAGDINQDYVVDNVDYAFVSKYLDIYVTESLPMGVKWSPIDLSLDHYMLDLVDLLVIKESLSSNAFSILFNY